MKILLILLTFISFSFADEVHTSKTSLSNKSKINEHKHDEHGKEVDHHDPDHKDDEHNKKGAHSTHDEHDEHDEKGDHSGEDDHGHGGGKAVGKGKAITEVDEKKGFRLSDEAIESLSIKFEDVKNISNFIISKESLVTSKNENGIYRYRDGFFKFITINIVTEKGRGYLVDVKSLMISDQIVVGGVGLLRVSDVYSTDESEYGHAH